MQALDSTPLSFFHLCSIDLVMILNKHVFFNGITTVIIWWDVYYSILAVSLTTTTREKTVQENKDDFLVFSQYSQASKPNFLFFEDFEDGQKKIKKSKLRNPFDNGSERSCHFFNRCDKIIFRRDVPSSQRPKKLDVSYTSC